MSTPLPESSLHSIMTLKRLLDRRIVRYAIVGTIGIPINNLVLAALLYLTGDIYWVSLPLAFEISTTVNFFLNQRFTYSEQTHLHGWDWPKRALTAQVSSISALLLAIFIGFALKYGFHLNTFIATDMGIAVSFFYNFLVSRRIVFRPAES